MRTHSPTSPSGPLSAARDWWRTAAEPSAETSEPLFRADLVAEIRSQIAAGTYDTPEKWEIALDRLLDRLSEQG
jgi:anti-sigma28 factor (negative regulator of flagellin synthesis)